MLESRPFEPPPRFTKGNLEMKLLPLLADVEEKDVAAFRESLTPEFHPDFDRMTEEEKIVTVALDRLSPDELRELRRVAAEQEYAPRNARGERVGLAGIHDLNNVLTPLEMFRYARRRRQERERRAA